MGCWALLPSRLLNSAAPEVDRYRSGSVRANRCAEINSHSTFRPIVNASRAKLSWALEIAEEDIVSGQNTIEDNKRIVQRCFDDVWNNGRLDAVAELVHPNFIRHHERNQDEDLHGVEGFRQWVIRTRQALPLRLTTELIFGEADRVMAHVRGRATHKGELKGVPATGTEIESTVTTFVRLADGKIVECWVIADTLGVLQQLGTVPRIG
jgi:predicted ester cyclase